MQINPSERPLSTSTTHTSPEKSTSSLQGRAVSIKRPLNTISSSIQKNITPPSTTNPRSLQGRCKVLSKD